MSQVTPRTKVAERFDELRLADDQLESLLEAAVVRISGIGQKAIDTESMETLVADMGVLRTPLSVELLALAAAHDGSRLGRPASDDPGPSSPALASAVQAILVALGRSSAAAAALYATSRIMCEDSACDWVVARLELYHRIAKALNALLPHAVAWELREEGLHCHCICPMCSIGACGCVWASMHSIDVASGGPGLEGPDERGIPLRSPPRPGSQLEAAGVRQWDRVVSLDGEAVRSPGQLQAALRRHAIGGEARLGIECDGNAREITVRHVSDWP